MKLTRLTRVMLLLLTIKRTKNIFAATESRNNVYDQSNSQLSVLKFMGNLHSAQSAAAEHCVVQCEIKVDIRHRSQHVRISRNSGL